jgi:BlaI family penicillinase repressor
MSLFQISESELEVMKIIWELNNATSAQIVERLINISNWKPKTIHTLITRLVAKGAIIAEKIDGKSYMYSPSIAEDEYKKYINTSFLQKMYNGSVNLMLASFIKGQALSKEEICELRKMLDEEV